MSKGTVRDDGRYWAFISYSHKDAAFGRRLHRRLEAYALPRRLAGRTAGEGVAVPRRLTPIFRDREEFPAAQDLSAEVRAALQESRSLIVVCSPAAAVSPWVAREVELFRELHPGRPVFAAIREGDPKDSLPPALRLIDPDGRAIEPLAADFRRGHDGWELGLLKLIAGLLGVGLDELVQRDGQRKMQRVMAVTVAALGLVLVMVVLTVFAMSARQEAERQRAAAEGVVEFMRTDLREKLRGVGRLDVMGAVNARALWYYDHEAGDLAPALQAQRAQVLQAIGEDDENRGQHNAALARFQEAWKITSALLADMPDDPERIFDHAQSEFWIGFVDYDQDHFPAAKPAFLKYKRLTDRLVSIEPRNPKYQSEAGDADEDLCSIALKPPKDLASALKFCSDALAHMEAAAPLLADKRKSTEKLINRHGWLADAYRANGYLKRARAERQTEEQMLNRLLAADPRNAELKDTWVSLQRAYSILDKSDGNLDAARSRLNAAMAVVEEMIRLDPSNAGWTRQRDRIRSDFLKLK
ncbi:MAG TPA: toll/interleukin-1 receptor domain-containing protein [Steroidobacteraceae bacterium]